jgi:tRNA threonylcarbamoyladenosine biosynthesis protein TsaE
MPSCDALLTLTLDGLEATRQAGLALGRALPRQAVVLLAGEMGAGKTTFAKAVCEALGVAPHGVTSPTYTLVNVYPHTATGAAGTVYHVDLYRMERADALLALDRSDWIHPEGVTLIEWPDAARPLLAGEAVLEVRLQDAGPERRTLELRGDAAVFGAVFEALGSLKSGGRP